MSTFILTTLYPFRDRVYLLPCTLFSTITPTSAGLRVLVLEKAPRPWAGGNTTFTAGAYRTVFHGLDDVLPLVRNVDAATAAKIDMDPYTEDDFHADLRRVTGGRTDPALAAAL